MSDIDTMEAGRELDALVAEKVMGIDPSGIRDEAGQFKRSWLDGYKYEETYFSTDIAAAWQVVERIRDFANEEDLYKADWKTGYLTLCDMGGGFAATFHPTPEDDFNVDWWENASELPMSSRADTAPLAICRAALKVLN